MGHTFHLADYGVQLFYGVLEAHDFIWFASYDVSGLSVTEAVVHNYALTYALSRFERGITFGQAPTYQTDLAQMHLYTTPAALLVDNNPLAGKIKLTWNALDTRTQRTQDPDYVKRNTPMLGRRVVLAPLTRFGFYVFALDGRRPPGAIRLGKKRSPCRVRYTVIPNPSAYQKGGTFIPSHLVNPLDVNGKVEAFNIVSIPPHLLLRNARLRDDYVVNHKDGAAYHVIHVPARVLKFMGEA
jgi:CRISPR-associated protein Csc1